MYDKNNSRENSNMAYSDVVQEYYKLVCNILYVLQPFKFPNPYFSIEFRTRNKKNGGNTYQLEPSVKPNLGKIGEMLEDVIWGGYLWGFL